MIGCLAERYKDEIKAEIPEVDVVIGTSAYEEAAKLIRQALSDGESSVCLKDISYLPDTKSDRLITTGGHYAYLKIAEGCDKHCTYCIIPYVRGRIRSRAPQQVLAEVQHLVDKGFKEIVLTGINTALC